MRKALASCVAATVILVALASAEGAEKNVLRYVPQADVKVLDPVVNTSGVTLQHSYLIYDNLLGFDHEFKPRPQMVDRWEISPDNLVYTFHLRDGLVFHDGSPVRAADAIASIKRWAARDSSGQQMVKRGMTLAALDDRSFTLTLKEPYGLVLDSFAKVASNALFIMREKEASTDANTPITETIGSGPFRFVKAEFVPGSKAVYERNPDYKPRAEPADFFAGGKNVKIDRLQWTVLPDAATAVNALDKGEIDMMEAPPIDLLPILRKNKQITIKVNNKGGFLAYVRPNHLNPPFNNVDARRALLRMADQADYMQAAFGDKEFWRVCWEFMVCGSPMASAAGSETVVKPDLDEARALLKKAGYKGEKIVVLLPTDFQVLRDLEEVNIGKMKEIGLNVEVQNMDWATLTARRTKQDPIDQGGWSIFISSSSMPELMNVSGNHTISGNCDRTGWLGWSCDDEMERLRLAWSTEPDLAKRKALAVEAQKRAIDQVPVIPLGQYFAPVAFRDSLSGVLEVPWPVFWNVEKKG